ncbi:hypothetical protein M3226_05230 [Neobacillus cucumis]|uniref:hypothetical protein n=1 Tax=Neobacillus cucumis TaxID=1740721 RepID=UPI00204006EC|nr:hypothetical protein [Neobacillus cucumis]MCM3725100.1 hypothetical protein [Neobacillus cucumis]
MGRYIECGVDFVYKYGLDQPSNLYLIHDMLGIGRINHHTAEESYGNGCDVLLLIKKDIKKLKHYFDLRVKQIERDKKLGLPDIATGEANFLRMINHLIYYADQHPNKDVYAFDSEL